MSALPAHTSSQTPDPPAGRTTDWSAAPAARLGASFPPGPAAPADDAAGSLSRVPIRTLAAAIAGVTGRPLEAVYHRLYRAARRLARAGQAHRCGRHWLVERGVQLMGRPAEAWLARAAGPQTLAEHVLPPGAERWCEADRQRFMATHAILRAWDAFRAARGTAADEAAAIFALAPAADLRLPAAGSQSVGAWAAARGLSLLPRSLRLYRARVSPGGHHFDGNVDGRGRHRRAPAEISAPAWELFRDLYLARNALPLAACWRYVAGEAATRGWSWPPLPLVRRRVRAEIPATALVLARRGPRAFNALCVPKMERDIESVAAGDWWALDGRVLDQFVRVPDARREWRAARPTVLGVLDLRSRCLVLELRAAEDADGILAGIAAALRAWGAPQNVVLDNGEAYKSAAGTPRGTRRQRDYWRDPRIGSVFAQIGVAVHNSLPYHAWAKPIESVWRKVKDGLDRWCWSFWGGSPAERPEGQARQVQRRIDALPTIEQLRAQIATWLGEYHATAQSGRGTRGLCPSLVMEQFRGAVRAVDPRVIALACTRKVGPVRVRRDGVRWQHLLYGQSQPEVWALHGRDVWLLIDPERADQVTIADEQGRPLCVATSVRLSGATQEQRREAARLQARARRIAREAASARDYLRRTPAEQVLAAKRRHAEARAAEQRAALPEPPAPDVQIVRPDLVAAAEQLDRADRRRAARRAEGLSSGDRAAYELLSTPRPAEPETPCTADLLVEMMRAG